MAGTTILSGSLITGDSPIPFQSYSVSSTIKAVMEAVDASFLGCDEVTEKRRSILLVYSIYSLLMDSSPYRDKFLLPLLDPEGQEHGFADVGDIAISDENGDLFECIKIVSGRVITPALIEKTFAEVSLHAPQRLCLLTIAPLYKEDIPAICLIRILYQAHGCEVLLDSIPSVLKCFLRRLPIPTDFLAAYRQAQQEDLANIKI